MNIRTEGSKERRKEGRKERKKEGRRVKLGQVNVRRNKVVNTNTTKQTNKRRHYNGIP